MINRHPQESKLLEYADGRLSDKESAAIESLIKSDPEVALIVQKFAQSKLPFREAFEPLTENIDDTGELANIVLRNASSETNRFPRYIALAASLVLGLLISSLYIKFQSEDHNNWIVQVADYQFLYTRDTVKHTQLSVKELDSLINRLNLALGEELIIPDLSDQKLLFKRGQILSVNGQPLIQLVYLPEHGDPVALCIIRNNKPDSKPKTGEASGMQFANWANNGLDFILIGKTSPSQLNRIAKNAALQMKEIGNS
jgi:anti-sigma factor RsiW